MQANESAAVQRVVILGGGPAGVAAAYWLSSPEQKHRYAVTLYTQGWRLGGKCASGRDASAGYRIEEHGLHLLMGCYQNGFATLRACYKDWREFKKDPSNPFQRWTDAFLPQRLVSMMEQDGPGSPPAWSPWNFPFVALPGEPGDAAGFDEHPGDGDQHLILRISDWLGRNVPAGAPYGERLHHALGRVRGALNDPSDDTEGAQEALRQAAQAIQQSLESPGSAAPGGATWNRFATLADLGVAVILGWLRDIYGQGAGAYDVLDAHDFKAWLASCGALSTTIASAPVRAFYDLAFAVRGSMAAGASLRAQLEMAAGYRGAPLWKMAAGMGDTVFTPFYDVLTARGVDIHFFSRVSSLRPAGDKLDEIDIIVQATTLDGSPYRPLVRVKNLDCWPDQPDWSQLTQGAELQAAGTDFEASYCTVSAGAPISPLTLRAGTDFDVAILAMPPDSLREPAAALAAVSPAWHTALGLSVSAATQSLQLWMKPDLESLGWTAGSTVLTAFAEPYDSWGDMSQVIARETWQEADAPGCIGYFCGVLQDFGGPVLPFELTAEARQAAKQWMDQYLRTLWPKAPDASTPGVLSQYVVANFDLSDRYVLTPAGANVASRLDPGQPAGFANLYAVGDWTRTRFSGGCFESAVESGMLASRAISGFPSAIKTR